MYRIILPQYTNIFTDSSESIGGAEDIIPVALSLTFEPQTRIFVEVYTVGGRMDAKVKGTFDTGNVIILSQCLWCISTL